MGTDLEHGDDHQHHANHHHVLLQPFLQLLQTANAEVICFTRLKHHAPDKQTNFTLKATAFNHKRLSFLVISLLCQIRIGELRASSLLSLHMSSV